MNGFGASIKSTKLCTNRFMISKASSESTEDTELFRQKLLEQNAITVSDLQN